MADEEMKEIVRILNSMKEVALSGDETQCAAKLIESADELASYLGIKDNGWGEFVAAKSSRP